VGRVEVVDTKKEPDSVSCLIGDGCSLAFSICTSKAKTRLRSRRADDYPPLGPPVVGERRRVLDEVEAEYTGEERDGGVVLVNDHGNQVNLHRGSVWVVVAYSALARVDGGNCGC
jgi:hypothetical protein